MGSVLLLAACRYGQWVKERAQEGDHIAGPGRWEDGVQGLEGELDAFGLGPKKD